MKKLLALIFCLLIIYGCDSITPSYMKSPTEHETFICWLDVQIKLIEENPDIMLRNATTIQYEKCVKAFMEKKEKP